MTGPTCGATWNIRANSRLTATVGRTTGKKTIVRTNVEDFRSTNT